MIVQVPAVAGQGGGLKGEIDLLRLIDVKKHTLSNEPWSFHGPALVTPNRGAGRLQIPYSPPAEYEIEIQATRLEGNNTLTVGLIAGERPFLLSLDGFAAASSGLALLDGKKASVNDSTFRGKVFENGQPATVTIAIRREGAAVRANGKTIIDWRGDFSRLSMDETWTVANPQQLWLGSFNSSYQIQKLVLRPLSATLPSVGTAAAWIKQVQALPAEEQVKAVDAKLKERNPGFDGVVKSSVAGGVISRLEWDSEHITNLSPVRALARLEQLVCMGPWQSKRGLSDLSPLAGMALKGFSCQGTLVTDLTPLKGMPLDNLNLGSTPSRT